MHDKPEPQREDSSDHGDKPAGQQCTHRFPNSDEALKQKRRGIARKVGSAIYTITGFRYAGRNFTILRKRASFPLLRRVIKDDIAVNKAIIETSHIRTELLEKTVIGQTFLLIFFGILFVWSILLLTKGLILLLKYGVFFDSPLIAAIPLVTLSLIRVAISKKTLFACKNEIELRKKLAGAK
jgi:hypothetical protein|tara:strand:+ start:78923 stop:79468 length:546 start_codon:yes stop_codon:yes gene_type:complete